MFPLGVFASLDAGLGLSFDAVRDLSVETVQLHTPHRPSRTPANATAFRERLQEYGVRLSVVFAGFDGESYASIPDTRRTCGIVPRETRAERMIELKEIADFARELSGEATSWGGGVVPVGLHLGFVPHDRNEALYAEAVQAAREICDHCAPHAQSVHLETGQEPADSLLEFLRAVDRPNLFVNFDPANMILYGCGDPIEAIRRLGDRVRSVHAKDAKWSDKPGETWGEEVALGEGDVGFADFLAALRDVGYNGPLTIEREIPEEPRRQLREVRAGLELLRSLTK